MPGTLTVLCILSSFGYLVALVCKSQVSQASEEEDKPRPGRSAPALPAPAAARSLL